MRRHMLCLSSVSVGSAYPFRHSGRPYFFGRPFPSSLFTLIMDIDTNTPGPSKVEEVTDFRDMTSKD